MSRIRILSSNQIKILAAILMVIDHMGLILFPSAIALRAIGRLSFPLFAFMISEGARYTRNKLKYFLTMAVLGIVCQLPMILIFRSYDLNVFITFALSLLAIFPLDLLKRSLFIKDSGIAVKLGSLVMLIASLVVIYIVCCKLDNVHVDYGLFGCLMPVFASMPSLEKTNAPEPLKQFDTIYTRILFMCIPLVIYCFTIGTIQYFALLAIPVLFLYSGKRGKMKMKYFFYIFYPAHLVALQVIAWLI